MLGFLKNKCSSCEFYSEYKTEDKLTKDKKVIKGKVEVRYCEKMKDVLKDLTACKMFEWRSSRPSFRSGAILHYLKNKK